MASTLEAMDLIFPSDSVIVVAGVPGAGKTTLLRRGGGSRQSDRRGHRRPHPRGPLLYLGHYARIAAAILGRGRSSSTRAGRNGDPADDRTLARLRGRPAHIMFLHADRETAEAGQRPRGRTVSQDEMDRQVARWHALIAAGGHR